MLKKLVIVYGLLLLSCISYGQTEQGKFLIGGSIDPSFSSFEKTKNSKISGTLKAGYFLFNKVNFGLSYDLGYYKQKNTAPSSSNSTQHVSALGVFNRLYYQKDKIGLFSELGAGIGFNNSKMEIPGFNSFFYNSTQTIESKDTFLSAKAGLGVDYFITSNVAAELLILYKYNDVEANPFFYYPKNELAFHIGFMVFIP